MGLGWIALALADGLSRLTGSRRPPIKEGRYFSCMLYEPGARMIFAGEENGMLAIWNLRALDKADKQLCLRAHAGEVTCLHALPR